MRGGDAPEPGPSWAEPMSKAETEAFVEAVGGELARRGIRHVMDEGAVRVERGGEWNDFGLTNLAQLCHQIGPKEWKEAIGSHFDNLFAAADAEAELEERARTFEGIRHLLKVRLYAGAALGGMEPGPPTSWELAPDVVAAFVYDLPTTVRTVNVEHIRGWQTNHDELLAVALENVRGDSVDSRAMAEGASAPVACFADHFFAASHAFLLGERLPAEANGSAVFAVPHRHALLYAPLVDLGVIESINRLIMLAAAMFQEGPGSISPSLYWWRDASVSLLPSRIEGTSLHFAPPDEFVAVLNELREPD
jgi:hypothetical protein